MDIPTHKISRVPGLRTLCMASAIRVRGQNNMDGMPAWYAVWSGGLCKGTGGADARFGQNLEKDGGWTAH
ncbi:hypothetical protein NBRC116584_08050 [Hydrogenophaga sp. 5NK40-0174]